MKVTRHSEEIKTLFPNCVLTVGNFDGFHLGHRELVKKTIALSKFYKCSAGLLTFDPHPVQMLAPEKGLKRLFNYEDLTSVAAALGLDFVAIEPFSRSFSELTANEFVEGYLWPRFNPLALVVGYDFFFGSGRQGNPRLLKQLFTPLNVKVEIVDQYSLGEQTVSSSTIRKLLLNGDVEKAKVLLDRYYYCEGLIKKGKQRGRVLGFPTANMDMQSELVPKVGVYSGIAVVRGLRYQAVANIGKNPTFQDAEEFNFEVHILDFDEMIYGEKIRFEFHFRLRDEKKFTSVDELKEQIRRDVDQCRQMI